MECVILLLLCFLKSKDHAMVDLEIVNRQLKAECQNLQDELATHEVELACQKRELEQLRQKCYQQEPIDHQQDYQQKGEFVIMEDM